MDTFELSTLQHLLRAIKLFQSHQKWWATKTHIEFRTTIIKEFHNLPPILMILVIITAPTWSLLLQLSRKYR